MAFLAQKYQRWYVVWYEHGRKVWRKTGTRDKAKAQELLEQVRAVMAARDREDAARGLLERLAQVQTSAVGVPVGEVWARYVEQPLRDMTERTRDSKRCHVEAWQRWMGETHAAVEYLHEVTPRLAAAYMASLADAAGNTRNNKLSALRSVWDVLRIPLGLRENPWEVVPRATAGTVRKKALTVEQVQALYRAAGEFRGTAAEPGFWAAAVAIGFYTGLRFGDVCTLDWSEVDAERRELRVVPNKVRKRGRVVVFALSDAVLRHFPARPAAGGDVWPQAAERYRASNRRLDTELAELFKAAGIQTWRAPEPGERRRRAVQEYGFHSLRHTYVTLLEDRGVDRTTIQTLVGHGSPAMTEHYSHARSAGKRVEGVLPELVGRG